MFRSMLIALSIVVQAQAMGAASPVSAAPLHSQWRAGEHYEVVDGATRTDGLEVTEFFWYACPHCYALEPFLVRWRDSKAADVRFVRVPVMWRETNQAHARLYYTLGQLQRHDLDRAVFDTLHLGKSPLAVEADANRTFEQQLQFAVAHGISRKDFTTAYNSPEVARRLQVATQLAARDKISSVPTIVINGKYRTDADMAGGEERLIALIDELVSRERVADRRSGTAPQTR